MSVSQLWTIVPERNFSCVSWDFPERWAQYYALLVYIYIYISQNNLIFPSQFETYLNLCFVQFIKKIQRPWNLHYLHDGARISYKSKLLGESFKGGGKEKWRNSFFVISSKITSYSFARCRVIGWQAIIVFK